jgi:hypothetical protein
VFKCFFDEFKVLSKKKREIRIFRLKTENLSFMSGAARQESIKSPSAVDVWGPIMWRSLASVSYNYAVHPTDPDKKNAQLFLDAWVMQIPCVNPCRLKATTYIQEHPPVFDSRESFSRWTVDFHNDINRQLGKRELPFEEAIRAHMQTTPNRRQFAMLQQVEPVQMAVFVGSFVVVMFLLSRCKG